MSKCRPTVGKSISTLTIKGVKIKDVTVNGVERFIEIEIPYDLLLTDQEVQKAFEDIVYIADETSDET